MLARTMAINLELGRRVKEKLHRKEFLRDQLRAKNNLLSAHQKIAVIYEPKNYE
jgi:hypothetical protein